MEKLVELLEYIRDRGYIGDKGYIHAPFIAHTHLDSKGGFCPFFLQDMLEESITKTQLANAFYQVFGYTMPKVFTYDTKAKSEITKEEFLSFYEPAAFRNVRSWIPECNYMAGKLLTREDLFNWVLSTAKTRVYLGDIDNDEVI